MHLNVVTELFRSHEFSLYFKVPRVTSALLNNFTDMLEIRDTVRQPILMKENETKTGAYFVIPTSSNILYFYRLKVSDIKRKIKQKNEAKED